MKLPRGLFGRRRPRGDPRETARLKKAARVFAESAKRLEVKCRLCSAAGTHVRSRMLTGLRGEPRLWFIALCDRCNADPDAERRALEDMQNCRYPSEFQQVVIGRKEQVPSRL
jgi:hypothetical protein